MKYGLNDHTVKRIAAIAHHRKGGNMHGNISEIYGKLTDPDTINEIANAHTTDAMQHRFANKDEENIFKRHLAHAAAINRGTLDPVPSPNKKNPTESGSSQV